ncbi:RPM1-interacting protein 4-like [Carica papaya]|uniref:RPM1-interacting protein 4-like n=1 Tax=Carica papaya TaxID=3649 RepID=UPI000B8C96DD|nr:RPM1-interacting protein 4-like [Carica papaya]
MATGGRPLPKFGEWDVTNPASAEGFTVIFNKARDEKKIKKSNAAAVQLVSPRRSEVDYSKKEDYKFHPKKKWLCCAFG